MHVRKLSTHLHTGSRKKISWESHNSVIPFRSIGSSAAFAQPRRLETIKRRAEEDRSSFSRPDCNTLSLAIYSPVYTIWDLVKQISNCRHFAAIKRWNPWYTDFARSCCFFRCRLHKKSFRIEDFIGRNRSIWQNFTRLWCELIEAAVLMRWQFYFVGLVDEWKKYSVCKSSKLFRWNSLFLCFESGDTFCFLDNIIISNANIARRK